MGTAAGLIGIRARRYRDERDWWAIRSLLVETLPRTPPGWNWDIRHWEGSYFHNEVPPTAAELGATVGVWETVDGRMVGAVHADGPGNAVLELDPDFRVLESEMVEWAEVNLAGATDAGGNRTVAFYVRDDDDLRRSLLTERGYSIDDSGGVLRRQSLDGAGPPTPPIPGGYVMRTTEATDADCARMAQLLNVVFRRTIHSAPEYRTFVSRSPSFDERLNLVVIAPDGTFASHVGFTFDAMNGHGIVEPVCTHPAHQRLGLARAMIVEGLGRLAAMGAVTASVETGERAAANALYEVCGFTEVHWFHPWRRRV